MRTIFYIDGFNFYYGLRNSKRLDADWSSCYWIDIVKFCSKFLSPGDTLIKVKYFTSSPLNVKKQANQSALLKANDLINGNKFEVIRGKFYERQQNCSVCSSTYTKPEEKRTDVNISVNLVGDCSLNNVDKIVLLSADSDLVPPVEFIRANYPSILLKIYFPPSSFSYDLQHSVDKKNLVRLEKSKGMFKNCIMPDTVENVAKTDSATIPVKWKNAIPKK